MFFACFLTYIDFILIKKEISSESVPKRNI